MSRVRALLAALLVATAALTASAQAQTGTLTPSGGAAWPQRSFVLTLPNGSAPSPSDIAVQENGKPVLGLRVLPADRRFGVMLVIDASSSMRGEAIHGALRAARAFAAQRPPYQPLGIVTFNDDIRVALAPTTDSTAIRSALSRRPELKPRTRLYDGVQTALGQLRDGRYAAGAVVVLSDGDDYGSGSSAAETGALARSLHAHLFTVGLQSPRFQPSSLQQVATEGGGDYLGAASTASLAGVYRELGGRLANAYLVRYRSVVPTGTRVTVTASAGGGQATSAYSAPALRVPGTVSAAPAIHPHRTPFLATASGRLLVGVAVLVLLVTAALLLVHQRRRARALVERVARYGAAGEFENGAPDLPLGGARPVRGPRMERVAEALDLARLDISPERFVLFVVACTAAATSLAAAALGPLAAIGAVVAVPLLARGYVRYKIRKTRTAFADQLADTVTAVASAMRTGHSFVGALAQAAEDAAEPGCTEFRRAVTDERLGVPLEEALTSVADRMASRDLGQVALVAVLQRETGGNGAEALDRVVENIRARDDLRRLLKTLTAQGKVAQRVLTGLPILTLIGMSLLVGDRMRPLFDTLTGRLSLIVSALLVAGAAAWIRKIVNIEV